MVALHDDQSVELAVIMSRSPGEIDAMGYLDSLSFLKAWAKRRRGDAAFEAALHGKELR